jgi:hypothetical protein
MRVDVSLLKQRASVQAHRSRPIGLGVSTPSCKGFVAMDFIPRIVRFTRKNDANQVLHAHESRAVAVRSTGGVHLARLAIPRCLAQVAIELTEDIRSRRYTTCDVYDISFQKSPVKVRIEEICRPACRMLDAPLPNVEA